MKDKERIERLRGICIELLNYIVIIGFFNIGVIYSIFLNTLAILIINIVVFVVMMFFFCYEIDRDKMLIKILCPKCKSDWLQKTGLTNRGFQKYRCLKCGKQFSVIK